LCDRVVVMRAGRVIDSGTPAALVRRYGRTAVVRFTLPALAAGSVPNASTALLDEPTALLDELRRLDGVRSLVVDGAGVTVQGDRRLIAHVGASLVRHRMVPDDLDVHVPSLEDAVLTLLEPSADDGDLGRVDGAIAARGELVGGRR
jgi:ABC-type multidrug transport system ATPase subunit